MQTIPRTGAELSAPVNGGSATAVHVTAPDTVVDEKSALRPSALRRSTTAVRDEGPVQLDRKRPRLRAEAWSAGVCDYAPACNDSSACPPTHVERRIGVICIVTHASPFACISASKLLSSQVTRSRDVRR